MSIDIPECNYKPVIIIGGGPCGLAIASRLCEATPGAIFSNGEHSRFHWLKQRGGGSNVTKSKPRAIGFEGKFDPDDILVLDKTGDSFMCQWHNQFDAVKIPHLRSPMFFHPDPLDIDSLVAFAHSQGREKELMEIHGVVGKEISKHHQKKTRMKRKLSNSFAGSGLVEVDRRDRTDYYRPGSKLFEDFCSTLVTRYGLDNVVQKATVMNIRYTLINKIGADKVESKMGFAVETSEGETFGCEYCIGAIGLSGKINYPINGLGDHFPYGSCHTTHLFQNQIQLPPEKTMERIQEGKHTEMAIVGGGLTSAQLTELVLSKGVDKVHLIIRGEIKIKHFDFHLEWVSKYQNYMKSSFWMKDSDLERFQMIESAREGGSMNPQYHKIVMNLVKSGRVVLHKFTEMVSNDWDQGMQKWKSIVLKSKITGELNELCDVDYICFATGTSPDITNQPMMKTLLDEYPIETINGVPCLTDDLQWNSEVPFFMLGRYAMLRTGPSSANLDGGRLGAERIGWKVQDMARKSQLKEKHSNPETLLRCTGGRCNWYSVLGETNEFDGQQKIPAN